MYAWDIQLKYSSNFNSLGIKTMNPIGNDGLANNCYEEKKFWEDLKDMVWVLFDMVIEDDFSKAVLERGAISVWIWGYKWEFALWGFRNDTAFNGIARCLMENDNFWKSSREYTIFEVDYRVIKVDILKGIKSLFGDWV